MKKPIRFSGTLLILLICCSTIHSQTLIRQTFNWDDQPTVYHIGDFNYEQWSFEGAKFDDSAPSHPYWVYRFPVSGPGQLQLSLDNLTFEPLDKSYASEDEQLTEDIQFHAHIVREPEGYFAKIACVPITRQGETYQRLTTMVINATLQASGTARGGTPFNSVLSDGQVYKIAISNTGMHRISYDFLKSELGISNLDDIDPRTIKIYGNGGGLVPYNANLERPDDLVENAIDIIGQEDGRFDGNDYILFYAEGPHKWRYLADNDRFYQETNVYDSRNYYFVKISEGTGLRIEEQASLDNTIMTTTTYDGVFRFEEDRVNVLHELESIGTGTGQHWYSDFFKFAREKTYEDLFSLPGLQTDEPVQIEAEMALRGTVSSFFQLEIEDQTLTGSTVASVPIGERNELHYYLAPTSFLSGTINLSQEDVEIKLSYPDPGGSVQSSGWLDFIQLRARLALSMQGDALVFRDSRTREVANATFQIDNTSDDIEIWDISNPLVPRQQQNIRNGNSLSFGVSTNGLLREFIAFRADGNFLSPEAIGLVASQNLHALESREMLIVYHPDFAEAAERLAEHRRQYSGLSVEVVPIEQVYNEFSSARVSPTAIRDFAKMIFERNGDLRYLLLIGDGSFDSRDLYGLGSNYIPVFEEDKNHDIEGFPADDFFSIFTASTPGVPLADDLSISTGRLPVNTPEVALQLVDKIIQYDTNPEFLQDWRTRMTFLGDDEDGARHSDDANAVAERVREIAPLFNNNKLLFDLFPQESTPAGDRFPRVEEELDRAIFRGSVITTYLGHGGPRGWAQERVLDIPRIQSWRNMDRLSVFVTATCTFGDFDNSDFVSAGEELLLTDRGGAIGLLTTTRPVYADQNFNLTIKTINALLNQAPDGNWPRFGDVIRLAKNEISNPNAFSNARKFMLMGDPAQRIALPTYKVTTTTINNLPLNNSLPLDSTFVDTLSALETVTISGQIDDLQGNLLSDFNGLVFPTVFDKRVEARVLQNDDNSPARTYSVRKNVLFRGRATVSNGQFSFSFVVPKDINYIYGPGKVSYYAADLDQAIDAAGSEERFIIGGSNPDGLADDTPPMVEVYLNSADFVSGGIVNANPTLVVKLADDFGINVTGNSIGHDLEGFLNEDTQNSYLLNDFYEAENDDYTKGEVRFPLKDLAPGSYQMRVRAWDVANNLGEGQTEFIVAGDGKIALQHVLNYPNPFTDRTCFQFDTNVASEELDVIIQIFTVSGRLVKTLEHYISNSDGALRLDDCIEWDGRDDFGDQLARGVYLYQVRVRSNSGQNLSGQSDFEKLVILK